MSMNRFGRSAGRLVLGACIVAFVGAGCAIDISIEPDPNPPGVGEPANYTLTVSNPLDCSLTSPTAFALVFPAPDDFDEADAICDIINEPNEFVCSLISGEIENGEASGVVDFCCEDGDFAEENPLLCEPDSNEDATDMSDLVDEIRELITERARELGLPVDDLLAAEARTGEAGSCATFPSGAVCGFDDIPMGGSDQASFEQTLEEPGLHYAVGFVFGTADCVPPGLVPGGSTCERLGVGVGKMAPLLSPAKMAGLSLALIALGAFAIRRKYARTDA